MILASLEHYLSTQVQQSEFWILYPRSMPGWPMDRPWKQCLKTLKPLKRIFFKLIFFIFLKKNCRRPTLPWYQSGLTLKRQPSVC